MSAVEEIRAAVTKLRAMAESATPGYWKAGEIEEHYDSTGMIHVFTYDDGVAEIPLSVEAAASPHMRRRATADAQWITLMQPSVAVPLAAWLESVANYYAPIWKGPNTPEPLARALDVARVINGGAL